MTDRCVPDNKSWNKDGIKYDIRLSDEEHSEQEKKPLKWLLATRAIRQAVMWFSFAAFVVFNNPKVWKDHSGQPQCDAWSLILFFVYSLILFLSGLEFLGFALPVLLVHSQTQEGLKDMSIEKARMFFRAHYRSLEEGITQIGWLFGIVGVIPIGYMGNVYHPGDTCEYSGMIQNVAAVIMYTFEGVYSILLFLLAVLFFLYVNRWRQEKSEFAIKASGFLHKRLIDESIWGGFHILYFATHAVFIVNIVVVGTHDHRHQSTPYAIPDTYRRWFQASFIFVELVYSLIILCKDQITEINRWHFDQERYHSSEESPLTPTELINSLIHLKPHPEKDQLLESKKEEGK
jgi:hypothetical protein